MCIIYCFSLFLWECVLALLLCHRHYFTLKWSQNDIFVYSNNKWVNYSVILFFVVVTILFVTFIWRILFSKMSVKIVFLLKKRPVSYFFYFKSTKTILLWTAWKYFVFLQCVAAFRQVQSCDAHIKCIASQWTSVTFHIWPMKHFWKKNAKKSICSIINMADFKWKCICFTLFSLVFSDMLQLTFPDRKIPVVYCFHNDGGCGCVFERCGVWLMFWSRRRRTAACWEIKIRVRLREGACEAPLLWTESQNENIHLDRGWSSKRAAECEATISGRETLTVI